MAVKEINTAGRRKTAIDTIALKHGKGRSFINGRSIKDNFGGRANLERMI